MRCFHCDVEMARIIAPHRYIESGLDGIWLEECETLVCGNCDRRLPILPDARLAAREIVQELVVRRGKLGAREALFFRKAMSLRGSELAALLGVHRVAVSRWENEKAAIDGINETRLRLLAVDRILDHLDASARQDLKARISSIMLELPGPSRETRPAWISVNVRRQRMPEAAAADGNSAIGRPRTFVEEFT
jgi:transcriptional regulator with XRE-family HTH domain